VLSSSVACKEDSGLHGQPIACTPGLQSSCACPAGATGTQRCADDGKSWQPCQCPQPMPDLAIAIDLSVPPDLSPTPDLATPLPAALAHWKLDELAGATSVVDSAGTNNGTVTGGLFMAGKVGNCFAGNGTSAYIDIGNPAALQLTGAMSVSAWVYINGFANNGRIVSKGGGPGMRGWSVNVESTGILRFMVALDTSTNISVDSTAAVTTGQWIHVTGVYQPSVALRLYLNGVPNNTTTTAVPAAQFDQALNINIARRTDGNYFDGRVDEVRIYGLALSDAEVTGLYRY
jgi:hypothetical protein